jgi:arabinan endo-1,5-alpha-L-arabinosidase
MKRVLGLFGVLTVAVALLVPPSAGEAAAPATPTKVTATYTNPLKPRISGGRVVENCPDPAVLRGRGAEAATWYMFCTSDPLDDVDTSGAGSPVFRRLPMMRSTDLVNWTYVGPALTSRPSWATSKSKLWAPDVVYSSAFDRYYMSFTVTDTVDSLSGQPGCTSDSAIGVAVASTPAGPWTIQGTPLVPPRRMGTGCNFASVIDSDVLGDTVAKSSVLYFGGFHGGLFAQPVSLTKTAMRSTGSPTQVASDYRYEAANAVHKAGWYYLLASAGACCNGPLSGYGTFVGRSSSPYGPFVDQRGRSMLAARTGGSPVTEMSGDRWIGPGHSSLFPDAGGQWWMAYHAVDATDPYFATEPGFTRRPPMLDPVDWASGWPSTRDGRGPSTAKMPAPAAKSGQVSAYVPSPAPADVAGDLQTAISDDFDGDVLDPRWTWVRQPDDDAWGVEDGAFRLDTSDTQLADTNNNAPVLVEDAPTGDFVAETKVALDLPATGCCYDSVQAGLVVYRDDDSYLKIVQAAQGSTRLTSLAKEVPPGGADDPVYGTSFAGAPDGTTWLRIVRRTVDGTPTFRAYTSTDGTHWQRGPAWSGAGLGSPVRLGLVAMGGSGFTARFDYVHVWSLAQ